MRVAGRQKLEDERFSWLDLDGDLFAGSQAIEKGGRGKHADIRIGLAELVVLNEDIRIKQIAQQIIAAHIVSYFLRECGGFRGKIDAFEASAGAAFERDGTAKNYFLQLAWPTAGRNTEDA